MAQKDIHQYKKQTDVDTVPFLSAEDAWFWFVQAQKAKNDGARFSMGQGNVVRPCEPLDILRVVDRLYRQRRLLMDHLRVLKFYGWRQLPPDCNRIKEMKASRLWDEALDRIETVLIKKNIVAPPHILCLEAAE